MYATLKATVRQGKIELLDHFVLPENVTLLVTVLEETLPKQHTLAAHLQHGLNDILHQRTTIVRSENELKNHLDALFGQD